MDIWKISEEKKLNLLNRINDEDAIVEITSVYSNFIKVFLAQKLEIYGMLFDENDRTNFKNIFEAIKIYQDILFISLEEYYSENKRMNIKGVMDIAVANLKYCHDKKANLIIDESFKIFYGKTPKNVIVNFGLGLDNEVMMDFIKSIILFNDDMKNSKEAFNDGTKKLNMNILEKVKLIMNTDISEIISYKKLCNFVEPKYAQIILELFNKVYLDKIKNTTKQDSYEDLYHNTMEMILCDKFINKNLLEPTTNSTFIKLLFNILNNEEIGLFIYDKLITVTNMATKKNFDIVKQTCSHFDITPKEYNDKISAIGNIILNNQQVLENALRK